jgi:MoaA/NifB/PqqE/SkfB family radical SAM enzyme
MESLRLLSELKKQFPPINFNVITIILNQNLEELIEIAQYVKSLGANSLQFQALLSNNLKMAERRKTPFWVSGERLEVLDDEIDKVIEFKKAHQHFIKNSVSNLALFKKYYRATLKPEDVKCCSADKTILVSNQGECTTCFSCYGDITKQNLREICERRERIEAQKRVGKCSWPCLLPCFCDYEL